MVDLPWSNVRPETSADNNGVENKGKKVDNSVKTTCVPVVHGNYIHFL